MAQARQEYATAPAHATVGPGDRAKDCCLGWFCELCRVLNVFCPIKEEPPLQFRAEIRRLEIIRLQEAAEQLEEEKNAEQIKAGKAIRTIEFELRQANNDKRHMEIEAESALRKFRERSHKSDQKIQELVKYSKDLEIQNKDLSRTVSRLRKAQGNDEKGDTLKELRISKEIIRDLQKDNENLQRFITDGSSDQEPLSDPQIITLFTALQATVQRIVLNFYHTDESYRPDTSGLSAHDVDRLSCWTGGVPGPVIKSKLEGILFQLLFKHILSQPVFGLEGLGTTGHLEKELAGFEQAVRSLTNVRESGVAKWRTSTIKLATFLNALGSSPPGPKGVAEVIQTALRPLEKTAKTVEAREALLDLCKDALEFALALRGLKDKYVIHIPEAQTDLIPAEANRRLSFKGETRDHDPESQTIAFTIYGGLFKYPESNPEKCVVLEKAQVVVL